MNADYWRWTQINAHECRPRQMKAYENINMHSDEYWWMLINAYECRKMQMKAEKCIIMKINSYDQTLFYMNADEFGWKQRHAG